MLTSYEHFVNKRDKMSQFNSLLPKWITKKMKKSEKSVNQKSKKK